MVEAWVDLTKDRAYIDNCDRAWLQVFPKVYINIKVFTAFQLVRGSAGR